MVDDLDSKGNLNIHSSAFKFTTFSDSGSESADKFLSQFQQLVTIIDSESLSRR